MLWGAAVSADATIGSREAEMEILRISNLSFTYPESDIPALDNISMSVNCGQFITIFGPSGCGKTTLLRLIKKELAPHGELKGDIIYRGRNISELDALSSVEIGFVLSLIHI